MKLLVVEDGVPGQGTFASILDEAFFQVPPVFADDETQATDLFISDHPDLVIIDQGLRGADAKELIARLRQIEQPGAWTPILMLIEPIESDRQADLESFFAAGIDDYLHKPLNRSVVSARLRFYQRVVQMRYSLVVLTRKLDIANQELKRLTSVDGLTGVANRRHFSEVLDREWRRSMRLDSDISILTYDIDYFTDFNEVYGHRAGDECLKRVSDVVRSLVARGGDLVARLSGTRFAIVLPETTREGAVVVAERIRQHVEQLDLTHSASPIGYVTLSLGVASIMPSPEAVPFSVVEAAGEALLRAKAEGRNRVCS